MNSYDFNGPVGHHHRRRPGHRPHRRRAHARQRRSVSIWDRDQTLLDARRRKHGRAAGCSCSMSTSATSKSVEAATAATIEPLRQDRRAHQQRRHRRPERQHLGIPAAGLHGRRAYRARRHLLRLPHGRAAHDRARLRPHRQCRLRRRQGRQSRRAGLFVDQGRRHRADQVAGQGTRQARHRRQLRDARGRQDDDGDEPGAGIPEDDPLQDSARAHAGTERSGLDDLLPRDARRTPSPRLRCSTCPADAQPTRRAGRENRRRGTDPPGAGVIVGAGSSERYRRPYYRQRNNAFPWSVEGAATCWRCRTEAMPFNPYFMFATGIENSNPTIDGGRIRVDQMEKCGHYERWREDFDLRRGARHPLPALRPAAPPHLARRRAATTGTSPTRPSPSCGAATSCRSSISAISACRTGSATSRTRTSPRCSPHYARAFAERFPWVQLYTPVNEMFICAAFSGALRLVERAARRPTAASSPRSSTSCKANVLAMEAILEVAARRDLHPERVAPSTSTPTTRPRSGPAEILNARALPVASTSTTAGASTREMYEYLLDNGMTREEYHFFLRATAASSTASWATTTT